MADALIVSLDEFAELAGVTSETMRTHLREMLREPGPAPVWLVERGDRGRAYKIEAEGALGWWQAKREADEQVGTERQLKLQQLRFETLGDAAEKPEAMSLSGRARREEYAAAMDAIKYRKVLGELVEKPVLVRVLTGVAVEHRRRLRQVTPEFAIKSGISVENQAVLDEMIGRAIDQFIASIEAPDAFAD